MITVFSVAYFHDKDHIITVHEYQYLETAISIVAEVWAHEPNNVYTIIDDTEK